MTDPHAALQGATAAANAAFPAAATPAGSPIVPCPMAQITIPPGCEYLTKAPVVEAPTADWNRIRKPATIGPPRDVQHQFEGGAAPVAAISQTVTVDGRAVEVISPKAAMPAGKFLPTVRQAADALGTVPSKQLDKIHTVVLNDQDNPADAYWATQYHQPGFHSAATGGPDGVTFYPDSSAWTQDYMDGTAIHEGGHAFSSALWKDPATETAWKTAITADGRSVSDYADAAPTEDFSETLVTYSLAQGTPCEATARKLFPNRFAALDGLLK